MGQAIKHIFWTTERMILRIGTRGSPLALAQSNWVKEKIEAKYPDLQVSLLKIKTKGDKILDAPLAEIGGKGLFVKEIEEALLRQEVDVAVHSMKDLPADLPEGLQIAIYPEREDPRDALVSLDHQSLSSLPEGASVGTGSLRRSAQLMHLRPDFHVVPLRGNVDTRLRKLESENLEAVILATAGLRRLGFSNRISQVLSTREILPAVGQGALGLELRKDDVATNDALQFLNHERTEVTVRAERAFLNKLEGGCQVPIAAFCRFEGEGLVLQGLVAKLDGSRVIRDEARGPKNRPEGIGTTLAEMLLASGADRILARIYGGE
jgi:hydroxymethylbilane synthase